MKKDESMLLRNQVGQKDYDEYEGEIGEIIYNKTIDRFFLLNFKKSS